MTAPVPQTSNILLDSDIRDWVVLPLFVIMVAAGLLRFYMGNILKPAPKSTTKVTQRTQASVRSTSALKSGAIHFLSTPKLEARKTAYPELLRDQAEWCEVYLENKEQADKENATGDDDMPNPFAAMDGMKGNMAFMVQNMVMMQAIQHFFSGFILLKVPFSLTMGFKQMFQKGLDGLATLDTSYVSSVSWYFLVMFGLRGFFRLVIGTPTLETQETTQLWHKLGLMPGGGPPTGPNDDNQIKALNTEADNLELLLPKTFKSNLDQVEKRLLKKKYPKKKANVGKGDFLLHQSTKKNK
mmetsp:Transcript_13322/g.20951  ORF Transcript_13322/g.20951 Transcript_13322/m.20951 type:complete len:298 (+) Transcript_13322:179-1072(+)